jgi:hypothetical protein
VRPRLFQGFRHRGISALPAFLQRRAVACPGVCPGNGCNDRAHENRARLAAEQIRASIRCPLATTPPLAPAAASRSASGLMRISDPLA